MLSSYQTSTIKLILNMFYVKMACTVDIWVVNFCFFSQQSLYFAYSVFQKKYNPAKGKPMRQDTIPSR
jgi:hypothetical protein